jgi:hypothetical protein
MSRDTGSAETALIPAAAAARPARRAARTVTALPQPQCALDSAVKWLGGCLPADFGLSAVPITDRPAGDFAAEELLIARAAGRRRNEFRTGRALARQALAQIGCAAAAILARAQRDPVWPAGFLASITHSEPLAFAVAPRPLA